jgi:predicted signal transduction protein with EAL and GGDEF domain
MFINAIRSRKTIEILSIAGIMAFFFCMDRSFGILNWVTTELTARYPGLSQYTLNLSGVGFIGLTAYSVVLRMKGRQESLARQTLEKFLKQQDFLDKNTGLSNRLGFKLMLGEMRNNEVMCQKSVIAFEIRNLDTIASVHGALTANTIESLYGNQIRSLSRDNDFAARAENGRFYLLINSQSADEIEQRVDEVINSIKQYSSNGIEVDNLTMSIHLNLGVLSLNSGKFTQEWDEEDIVQRLDYMLYCSRNKSHEFVETYDETMENSLRQRAIVESELLDALHAGQIVPYFQPCIDMKTNRVSGLEILARWEHPTEGFIRPDVFVHIAEEVGAMREFTLTMLRHACEAAVNWPDHIKLAFNVSPNELRSEATTDGFFEILKETGISSDRIEVEITENAFIEEVGEITEAVERLKKRGVQISIDDFGTGFSNLTHLKMLPFDKIKIDQSFIRDMASNPESVAIVKNVIALGKSLGLPTVAEGIELDGNRDMLQELGCSIGQGYLYAKALRAEDVMPFIESYHAEVIYLDKVA